MDLAEYRQFAGQRHPWELARIAALRKVLAPHLHDGMRILDMGCGDGFVSRKLFGDLGVGDVTAVDINLTDERIGELETLSCRMRYLKAPPSDETFQLLLLLDVIEHVEDDRSFLRSIVDRHVAPGGQLLVTVPSFQSLYGHHDAVLGHYRRYRIDAVEEMARASGLAVLSSGYLFGTLLLPKLLCNKLWEHGIGSAGVGSWLGGRHVTFCLEAMLNLDNALLLRAARLGIRIPGLSAWALCRKSD